MERISNWATRKKKMIDDSTQTEDLIEEEPIMDTENMEMKNASTQTEKPKLSRREKAAKAIRWCIENGGKIVTVASCLWSCIKNVGEATETFLKGLTETAETKKVELMYIPVKQLMFAASAA